MPPPRRVLMISLESTTISPTPIRPTSPARKRMANLLTTSLLSRWNALLTLSPSFFHALLSKMKVLSASFTNVVKTAGCIVRIKPSFFRCRNNAQCVYRFPVNPLEMTSKAPGIPLSRYLLQDQRLLQMHRHHAFRGYRRH